MLILLNALLFCPILAPVESTGHEITFALRILSLNVSRRSNDDLDLPSSEGFCSSFLYHHICQVTSTQK
jgi:hypothetical protein